MRRSCCSVLMLVLQLSYLHALYNGLAVPHRRNQWQSVSTGYYIENMDQTEIFADSFVPSSTFKLCCSFFTDDDLSVRKLCWKKDFFSRLIFPGKLDRITSIEFESLYITSANLTAHTFWKSTYAITKLAHRPIFQGRVHMMKPEYGSILHDALDVALHGDFDAAIHAYKLEYCVAGVSSIIVDPSSKTLRGNGVQPGTWFITSMFQFNNGKDLGYPIFSYVEYVLPPSEIRKERLFRSEWKMNTVSRHRNCSKNTPTSRPDQLPAHICIWAPNRIDGQKIIWLQQTQHLDPVRFSFTVLLTTDVDDASPGTLRHAFSESKPYESNSNDTHSQLKIKASPFYGVAIEPASLEEAPPDGEAFRNRASDSANSEEGNEQNPYLYASQRLRIANYNIDDTKPTWVREIFSLARNFIVEEGCDIVVYGNSKGFSGDSLIREAAFALGVPSVSELVSVDIDEKMLPDVVVSPSMFALQHKSVAEPLRSSVARQAAQGRGNSKRRSSASTSSTSSSSSSTSTATTSSFSSRRISGTRAVVISPGVDASHFSRESVGSPFTPHRDCTALVATAAAAAAATAASAAATPAAANQHGDDCSSTHGGDCLGNMPHSDDVSSAVTSSSTLGGSLGGSQSTAVGGAPLCLVVGFVGRLAPGKSPGMFLRAAYELLQTHPLARFTIIGDGELRPHLEDLAARMGIDWAVRFLGWVTSSALPRALANMDVVVNPSLSETFCIANIEVMSMGIPLVSFAVQGMGEYVDDPAKPPFAKPQETEEVKEQEEQFPHHQQHQQARYQQPLFYLASNAVIVNEASPLAIAAAVRELAINGTLRSAIGAAARATVESHFTIDRQMHQYADLYQSLVGNQ